jgi:hypothetical protein
VCSKCGAKLDLDNPKNSFSSKKLNFTLLVARLSMLSLIVYFALFIYGIISSKELLNMGPLFHLIAIIFNVIIVVMLFELAAIVEKYK